MRLRANRILQDKVAHLLKPPVGRPPNHVWRIYGDVEYQAASWDKPRRIVAKVSSTRQIAPTRVLRRHQHANEAGLDNPLL